MKGLPRIAYFAPVLAAALCFAPSAHAILGFGDSEEDDGKESPWLITPTVSSDPKLGTNVGGVFGYLHQFDPESPRSLVTSFGNYSNTDSYTYGLFADTYFGQGVHRLKAGIITGKIRNEYDDFLGTGLPAKTEDNIDGMFVRYTHAIGNNWHFGAQALSSNYTIGADGLLGGIMDQIGLTGFDSNGIGLVGEYDTRDNVRNPTEGTHFVLHNVAYRESLGGEESFDTLGSQAMTFIGFGDGHVLGIQAQGRWTHDAPQGGYSSLTLRGYTRGNYLNEHYTHIDFDARFKIRGRWGAALFAGVGCLYSSVSDCGDGEDLYPSVGAGVIYTLKPEAGFVIRAEYAQGESDNSAFYLRLGHPF